MMKLLVLFVVLILMDIVWLTFRRSYHESLFASIQKSPLTIRILPAVLVYILVACALYYFVFIVGRATTRMEAGRLGALLGGSMYGLYDLTNYATLRGYTLEMTVVDTLWGMTTCGVAAAVAARV
jgi:uncharacterized membrane protein